MGSSIQQTDDTDNTDEVNNAFDAAIATALKAHDQPKASELKRYLEGKLDASRAREIDIYLRISADVRDELTMLADVLRLPIPPRATLPTAISVSNSSNSSPLARLRNGLRTVIEATFRPPTLGLAPLRGGALRYETPSVMILVIPARTDRRMVWTLSGMLTRNNVHITDLEAAFAAPTALVAEAQMIEGELLDGHSFEMADLEPGLYDLFILTATEEIHIKALSIGGVSGVGNE